MLALNSSFLKRCAAALILTGASAGYCATGARAQTIAVVNGSPITNFDIEQRSKLVGLSGKPPNRKDVIEELINDRIKLREGKKYSLDLTPAEIDSQFASMGTRMRLNAEQLTKVLESKGIRPETLKARLKAEYVWTQLVRGRFQQSLTVGDKDVEAALGATGEAKQDASSFEYQMRPLVLIVARGAPASAIEERRKEAVALRERVESCDQAVEMFRTRRDSVVRDMVTKTSADLPPPLREVLDKTPIGRLTAPEVTRQGIEMVALCERKASTDTPQKREIRNKLFADKYEAQSKKYLNDLRRASMIEYR